MSISSFPELRTSRFVLRRIVPSDIETIFIGLSDPQVIAHYGVSYSSLEATKRQMAWFDSLLVEGKGIWWGICDPARRERLLGASGFNDLVREHRRAELGYWLLPDHWGNGVARECVASIVDYGFGSLGLHRIGAEVDVKNVRSSQLLERVGFRFEGICRGYELKGDYFLDLKRYSILSTDLPACI